MLDSLYGQKKFITTTIMRMAAWILVTIAPFITLTTIQQLLFLCVMEILMGGYVSFRVVTLMVNTRVASINPDKY